MKTIEELEEFWKKPVKLVKAMEKLIMVAYNVSEKTAKDIVSKVSNYNVQNLTDVFEKDMGYKPKQFCV